MTWTRFMDMHSGGGCKEPPYEHIFIEAPEGEARVIFFNRFQHSPSRVSCTCCGEDYSVSESSNLEQATGYDRNCYYNEATGQYEERRTDRSYRTEYIPLETYLARPTVLVIPTGNIKDEERRGSVPVQGYTWVD